MLSLACLVLAVQIPVAPLRVVRLETFEQPGTSWSQTLFPDELLLGGTVLTREPLTLAQGAPDTQPPLPINAGGDLEGRLFELTFGGTGYALTADVPENHVTDGAVRAFVAIGVADPFGAQSVGLLVRASINPNPPFGSGLNAYTAQLIRQGSGAASFVVSRWRNGVITPPDVFANVPIVASFAEENFVIALHAEGDLIVARLWRVRAQAGGLVIEPVPLGSGTSGPTNTIAVRDGELASGRFGVDGFARGGNSVFWDDVQLGLPADGLATPARAPAPLPAPGR